MRVLTTAGFAPRTALVRVVTIFDYTLGSAFEEQADPDHVSLKRSSVLRAHLLSLDSARFPYLTAALDDITATAADDPHVGFKGGIRLLLAGMAMTKQTTGT